MKKIVIVDGGPRKNMNTAQLLQRFAEGAKSVGEDVEVKAAATGDKKSDKKKDGKKSAKGKKDKKKKSKKK